MSANESDSIDARWRRERRRVGIRAGLGFAAIGLTFKVIERTGILAQILGTESESGGPFTVRWVAAVLGGAILAGAFFGYATGWTVKPPRANPSDA